MHRIDKAFPGVQALEGVDFELASRRDPRPRRRERRRQVDADQGPDRRRAARPGHDRVRRSGRPGPLAAARPVAGHQHGLPGSQSLPEPVGRREHPDRARAQDVGPDQPPAPWTVGHASSSADSTSTSTSPSRLGRTRSRSSRWRRSPGRSRVASARVLILDEPTSSLDAHETDQLFRVMRKLRSEGRSIVFITHFLDQVYAVADRITVLRNGRLVGTYPTAALPRLDLIAKMLGRNLTELDDMTRIKLATKPDEAGEVRLVGAAARPGRLDRAVRPGAASRRGRRAGRPARLGTDRDGVAAVRRREARHRHAHGRRDSP